MESRNYSSSRILQLQAPPPSLLVGKGPSEIMGVSPMGVKNPPDPLQSPETARPGISTKKTEKIPLGPKFWNPEKIPRKYGKNTQNGHFWYFGGIFRYFRGNFGGTFWASRISGGGVFFRSFSSKFQARPSRVSVAGRGVPKMGATCPCYRCCLLRLTILPCFRKKERNYLR